MPENFSKNWDAEFAVHQLIIGEVNELIAQSSKNIPQIEELLMAILDLIHESNYGRDEFFILIEHLKTLNKKLACAYLKEYQRIYSSKISV
ncbi:MAG: hypothetical protein HC831_14360 [Chloroflexia bacterium]|nr:hypothetical protein [Chloroflexia bacterium]